MSVKTVRKAFLISTSIIAVVFIFAAAQVSAAAFSASSPRGVMASAANGRIAVTWEKMPSASYYLLYEGQSSIGKAPKSFRQVGKVKGSKRIRKKRTKGKDYTYYVVGVKVRNGKKIKSKRSVKRTTTLPKKGKSTLKNFLRAAKAPMGSTMYVWGGGWNKADTGSGPTTRRTGLYPRWRRFANTRSSSYDYRLHRYEIYSGLDCTGLIGFSIYNVMNTKNGKKGYVIKSTYMAKKLSKRGLGSYTSAKHVKKRRPGDIMSTDGHAWISLGECSDGSVVILHASPPVVTLAGTPSSSGKKNSKAARLAKKYLKKYYGKMYRKYRKKGIAYRDRSFLKDFARFRWSSKVLSDPDGYRKKTAAQVLKDLFK